MQARTCAVGHECHTPPRILLAEDDTEMRRLVTEVLQRDGYEVREAADGGRLLVQVTAQYREAGADIDLIISDNRMPICTGLQILQGLRDVLCAVPMILMTAFIDDRTRATAEALGAIVFDKPFDIDDLRTAVQNVLPVTGREIAQAVRSGSRLKAL